MLFAELQGVTTTQTRLKPSRLFAQPFDRVARPARLAVLAALSLMVVGCGGDEDPISVSAPVGINLKAEAGDVDNNVITIDKNINTETGNPWGAFVADVDGQLGGPPGDMELQSLELLLATSSEGYSELRDVFDGTIDVQFEMNDTGNFFPAGSVAIDSTVEGRSIVVAPQFNFANVQATDLDKLLAGSFKVVLSGPAAAGFEAADGKAELQLTFTFAAFE